MTAAAAAAMLSPEVLAALETVRKALGDGAVATAPTMTIKELWERYARAEKSRIKSWERTAFGGRAILAAWGDRPAAALTLDDVDAWRAADRARTTVRGGPPKPASRNRVLVVLRRLMHWGVERGHLASNPLARLRMERAAGLRQTVLSDDDIDRLLAACDPLLRVLVLVLADTGCRRGEIFPLTWAQVDGPRRCIHLAGSQCKNGKPRSPMLSKRALAALLSVPRVEGSPYVFTAGADRAMRGLSRPPGAKEPTRPDGRVYGQRHLFQRFVEAVKRAGLQGAPGENIGFHVLRHSFIARARRLRIPDRTTMAATGHLSLAAFARYGSRVDDAEMRAAFDLLEGGKTVQP